MDINTDDGLAELLDDLKHGRMATAPMPCSLGSPIPSTVAVRIYTYPGGIKRRIIRPRHVVNLLDGRHLVTDSADNKHLIIHGWSSVTDE